MTRVAGRRRGAPVLLGALVGAMVAGRAETLALAFLLALLGSWLAGAGRPAAGWLRAVGITAGIAVALNLWLSPGAPLPLPRIFGASATMAGLRQGLLFAARLVTAAVALRGLRSAWPGEQAADELADRVRGLERIGIPVRRIRAMAGLAIRFVPMLTDESRRIAAVQNLRAGRRPRGLAEKAVRARAILVPALVASLERAGQVALALEARHYRLREPARMPRAEWPWRGLGWMAAGAGLLWR
jgi:energy-coupling factor transporter transmembrane protein EcfT